MRALQKHVVVLLWLSVAFAAYRIHRDSPKQILSSDGVGYYSYLPALFIYHDPTYAFLQDYRRDYQPVHEFIRDAGSAKVNQYFVGEALLSLPFFIVASGYVALTHGIADGFSPPYQWAFMAGALFYLACSLLLLRKVLIRFVLSETLVGVLLILLVWGTNLINYAAREFCYSHVFSLFAFSVLFYAAMRLSETLRVKHLYTLAAAAALIALIRPSNLVVLCCVPFFMQQSPFKLLKQLSMVHMAGAVLFGALLLGIQPALWYWQTGNWLVDAYTTASFDFLHPHLYLVLLSFEKGWWLYTPLALLAILGIVPLFTQRMYGRWGVFVFLLANIWIISSWSHWHYGPTFGQRPFVESYALLVTLAGIGYTSLSGIMLKRIATGVVFLLGVFNVIQFIQYQKNILHPRYMNKELYMRIFLKLDDKYRDLGNIPSNACTGCSVEIPLTLSGGDTLLSSLPVMTTWDRACIILEGNCERLPSSPADFLLLEALSEDSVLFSQRVYMQRCTNGEKLFPLYYDKVLRKHHREAKQIRITYHNWSRESKLSRLQLKVCGQLSAR